MAYWKFKKEVLPNEWNELEEDNLVCFVGDNGEIVETMTFVDDDELSQGVIVTRAEKIVIHYLSKVFGLLSAIDFVTAVRFEDERHDAQSVRFLLQTELDSLDDDREFFDDDDVCDELHLKQMSVEDYCNLVGKDKDSKFSYADYFFLRSIRRDDR